MENRTYIDSNPIAQGCLTNSKHPDRFIKEIYPKYIKSARECFVQAESGKEYIDFIAGLGSNILGYSLELYKKNAIKILESGISFSLPTRLEEEAGNKVKEIVPFIDKVKFVKTGTEACMAALKIARAHTGRDLILSEGYHGWSDPFISLLKPAAGVPKDPNINELKTLSQINGSVAAVIIEPINIDASESRKRYLEDLQKVCRDNGTLLIFDEVITGLRWPTGTFSYHSGIHPDLICMGKALANGLPIGVVGGSEELMDNPNYFVSGTFAGDRMTLQRLIDTVTRVQTLGDNGLPLLWREGEKFLEKFNSFAPADIRIEGYPTRGVFKGRKSFINLFHQEACKAGLLFGPSFFFTFAHIPYMIQILSTCEDIIKKLHLGNTVLEGQPPRPTFFARARK